MHALLELKEQLLTSIPKDVLAPFAQGLRLTGLICYGSRVAGGARENSDLDMMALVETENDSDFYGEFHGVLSLDKKTLPVEIRIYSSGKLQELLAGEDPKRLYALKKSLILLEKQQELQNFKAAALEKFDQIIEEFKTELLSLKPDEILPILQITASEQYGIAQSLIAKNQTLAAYLGFFEFFVDYLTCTESCSRSCPLADSSAWDENSVSNLYFLRAEKGGRFLNFEKYQWSPQYAELIQKINSLFNASASPLEQAYSVLDQHFYSLFQKSLLIPQNTWPCVRMN